MQAKCIQRLVVVVAQSVLLCSLGVIAGCGDAAPQGTAADGDVPYMRRQTYMIVPHTFFSPSIHYIVFDSPQATAEVLNRRLPPLSKQNETSTIRDVLESVTEREVMWLAESGTAVTDPRGLMAGSYSRYLKYVRETLGLDEQPTVGEVLEMELMGATEARHNMVPGETRPLVNVAFVTQKNVVIAAVPGVD